MKTVPAATANRLRLCTSPYLRQHADNPVDWYPWGEEAFRRAETENKPVFLSIGYSACHWCHVMAHESFADQVTARLLNDHFVAIKVDREERPDVDEIYMMAVQAMTGSGGWPLSVFLTPDRQPFYGGTYFPPEDRYGHPGFKRVLAAIVELWENDPRKVRETAAKLTETVHSYLHLEPAATDSGPGSPALFSTIAANLQRTFDQSWGGFGQAPKFPAVPTLDFLLLQYVVTRQPALLEMVTVTLDRMAAGGIYDHLGGGFHRYSTDREWLVPHFEKMLYDNALLATTCLHAGQLTGSPRYRHIAAETLDYLLREMRDPHGGFHSAEDADSGGGEGLFYLWTPAEIRTVLGPEDGALFCRVHGVTEAGNYEGRNILHLPVPPDQTPPELQEVSAISEKRFLEMRNRLREARAKRPRPGRDDKVLASWNGLTISALCLGYQVLGDTRYLKAAEEAAGFIVRSLLDRGRLHHVFSAGQTGGIPGFLDDYAAVILGFLDLYESAFDPTWIQQAAALGERMLAEFLDTASGNFYLASAEHDGLLFRPQSGFDGPVPAPAALAAVALLRLGDLTGKSCFSEAVRRFLENQRLYLAKGSQAMQGIAAVEILNSIPPLEIVILGPLTAVETSALLVAAWREYLPRRILVQHDPASSSGLDLPALVGKTPGPRPMAYVCRDNTCLPSGFTPEAFSELLHQTAAPIQ